MPLHPPPGSLVKEANAEPIPGYRLIEPLGSGGFGEAWSCEAPGGIHKAIKFVFLEVRKDSITHDHWVYVPDKNLRTHRLTGHFVGDPQVYRDKEALKEERETKDPIKLLGARLEIGDDEFAALDAEVTAEVEAAVEFAKAGTDPAPEDALKYVYA